MKRILAGLAVLVTATSVWGWNAAGHRLVAAIAWRSLSPAARQGTVDTLRRHPDYPQWTARAQGDPGYAAFLEAATWPDDIRNDPRFYDEAHDAPTPAFPGMPDTARHKAWHYVDRLPNGQPLGGELDRQLDRLIRQLRQPKTPPTERTYALPWLIHLMGDIHQPLHVGSRDDEGGNRFEIENPFNRRQPFTKLHTWWDELPGPPWLRGARLERRMDDLLTAYGKPPRQGDVALWIAESREISRSSAYPTVTSSLLPAITPDFQAQSQAIAQQRLVAAGYRLGHLLEDMFNRVSRETD